jgi:hypothetical protein
MIEGTRFFAPELYQTPDDLALNKAFVAADLAHKQDPSSITEIVPVPRIRMPAPEPLELYDLEADPGETHDLAAEHPDRVARMQAALENWFERVEADRRTIAGAPC